jgi:transposase
MEHQQTQGGGERAPLGVDHIEEVVMSQVVGIDVGAYKHAAAVCRSGEVKPDQKVFRYAATRQGFNELDLWLERQGPVDKVVMESSGHYWWPLASHLHRRGLQVAVVNPLKAKYFAKSRLQRSKSDPADARTLAALGLAEPLRTREPLMGAELREAARFCMRLVRDQANVCQRLTRLIEIGFPELKDAFEDPTCETALAVLRQAPTARSAGRRRLGTLAEAMRPGGHRRLGETKARRIHELAEQTIAPPEMDQQMAFQVGLLIQQYDLLAKQIELAEKRVAGLLDSQLALRLQTIPGVGAATAATLMAEIGDIWRFDDFDQLAAYAGTHPMEQSSGRHGAKPETSWRMAKTGNSYLRSALYRMAIVGIQHNPILKEHYRRKRMQGKAPMNAIGHCMAKSLAIVWGVWRSGRSFDRTKGSSKA